MSRNSQHRDWWIFRYRRMELHRADGDVYQHRWGLEIGPPGDDTRSWGRLYLHRYDAPDPGQDMHDHPWSMVSLILRGGYTEQLADVIFEPPPGVHILTVDRLRRFARPDKHRTASYRRGRIHRMGLGAAHQIVAVHRIPTWTLMLGGPARRVWGFYTPDGWVDKDTYEATIRAERRDLVSRRGLL